MSDAAPFYLVENLKTVSIGTTVSFGGEIRKICRNRDGSRRIEVADVSGAVIARAGKEFFSNHKAALKVGARVMMTGSLFVTRRGDFRVNAIGVRQWDPIPIKGAGLDGDPLFAREQLARLYVSKATEAAASFLRLEQFWQISTRTISREWRRDGLEELKVQYPGFGSLATLAVSPSSQLSDFLGASFWNKVFAVGRCYAENYRFVNLATDSVVVMAKMIDHFEGDLKDDVEPAVDVGARELVCRIAQHVRKSLDYSEATIEEASFSDKNAERLQLDSERLWLSRQKMNVPVIERQWSSALRAVLRLVGDDGNLLVEAAIETLGKGYWLTTVTIYPEQFLDDDKMPSRQIDNLGLVALGIDSVYM